MDEMTCQVYVRTDAEGRVTAINSSAFLPDPAGWTLLAEGSGDRYLHAQSHFLPGPLTDERGVACYRLEGSRLVPRTAQEMDADYIPPTPETDLSLQVALLQESNRQLQEALAQLAARLEAS